MYRIYSQNHSVPVEQIYMKTDVRQLVPCQVGGGVKMIKKKTNLFETDSEKMKRYFVDEMKQALHNLR